MEAQSPLHGEPSFALPRPTHWPLQTAGGGLDAMATFRPASSSAGKYFSWHSLL